MIRTPTKWDTEIKWKSDSSVLSHHCGKKMNQPIATCLLFLFYFVGVFLLFLKGQGDKYMFAWKIMTGNSGVISYWAVLEGKCYTYKCRQLLGCSYDLTPTQRSACSLTKSLSLIVVPKSHTIMYHFKFTDGKEALRSVEKWPGWRTRKEHEQYDSAFFILKKYDTERVGWSGGVGIGAYGKAAKIALPNISKNMVQRE